MRLALCSLLGILVILPRLASAQTPDGCICPPPVGACPANPNSLCTPACPAPKCCGEHQGPRLWAEADLLLWWVKSAPNRTPLLTTGPLTDPFPGALDQPGTRILFGDHDIGYGVRTGLRLNAGYWLDDDARFALEGGGFWLSTGRRQLAARGDTTGTPVLGHPYVDALTGNENLSLLSVPASVAGSPLLGGTILSSTMRLSGYDLHLSAGVWRQGPLRVRALVGFRSLLLDEALDVTDALQAGVAGSGVLVFQGPANLVNPPSSLAITDSFRVHNRFFGGQVGGQVEWASGPWTLGLTAKLALGVTEETAQVNGQTTLNTPGAAPRGVPGGTYALASNIGRHSTNHLAWVPEGGLTAGYAVTSWLTARVGYSALYWSRVERPGNLIDRTINPNQVPSFFEFGNTGGPARPAFVSRETDFWAHGVSLGLDLRF